MSAPTPHEQAAAAALPSDSNSHSHSKTVAAASTLTAPNHAASPSQSSSTSPSPSHLHPSTSTPTITSVVTDEVLKSAVLTGQHLHSDSSSQAAAEESSNLTLNCKWNAKSYELVCPATVTVGYVKTQLALLTNVRPHHQKLIMKTSPPNQRLLDDRLLSDLGVKTNAKVMMIGNVEKDLIIDDADKLSSGLVDDLDYDYRPVVSVADSLLADPAIRAKMDKYGARLAESVTLINPLRPGKALLVLDLDYTLFDMHGVSSDWNVLRRPYTHQFLTAAYQHFELVLWSQTSWRWLELKVR